MRTRALASCAGALAAIEGAIAIPSGILQLARRNPVFDIGEAVRGESAKGSLSEILKLPTKELLGVSEDAASALRELGIETIFDLGASNLFATAREILRASEPGSA